MKKIITILGMIACIACLTACGAKEPVEDARSPLMVENCEGMVDSLYQIYLQDAADMYSENEVTYKGIMSFSKAMDNIGTYEGTNGGRAEFDDEKETIVIDVNVLGSKHNAVVEFVVEGSAITSISTSVDYSFGELMQMAALNTVIGMGTVFCVLIIISVIIACFGFVGKGQRKPDKAKEAESAKAPVVEQIAEREELSDDTELVAVIAAAIAAYEGSASTDGFVVRSIRKSNKSKWQNA